MAAMDYSLTAGGKRLRPALTLGVSELLGVEITPAVLKAACAVELIHTYSLIHDDLPAMDNDDLRRGKPTNHKKFGAGMATLAGDGLLTLAFSWLSENELPNSISLHLVQALAKAAGPAGMVAGQARDIAGEGHHLTLDQLKKLHAQKTGALLAYSVVAGGIIAGASENVIANLQAFGKAYGLAFQIKDDLLDVTATEAEVGKEVHRDAVAHKNTYPSLLGIEGAKQALLAALKDAKAARDALAMQLSVNPVILDEFLAYFED
ncbi:MAG TPA: polyprenyl synthetase family protein [Candidatus Limosilactobacillus faecipullorum]|nr:polyprenyl synthetase family protein [Candidatus Limosilactobacillus faecipullorum]